MSRTSESFHSPASGIFLTLLSSISPFNSSWEVLPSVYPPPLWGQMPKFLPLFSVSAYSYHPFCWLCSSSYKLVHLVRMKLFGDDNIRLEMTSRSTRLQGLYGVPNYNSQHALRTEAPPAVTRCIVEDESGTEPDFGRRATALGQPLGRRRPKAVQRCGQREWLRAWGGSC